MVFEAMSMADMETAINQGSQALASIAQDLGLQMPSPQTGSQQQLDGDHTSLPNINPSLDVGTDLTKLATKAETIAPPMRSHRSRLRRTPRKKRFVLTQAQAEIHQIDLLERCVPSVSRSTRHRATVKSKFTDDIVVTEPRKPEPLEVTQRAAHLRRPYTLAKSLLPDMPPGLEPLNLVPQTPAQTRSRGGAITHRGPLETSAHTRNSSPTNRLRMYLTRIGNAEGKGSKWLQSRIDPTVQTSNSSLSVSRQNSKLSDANWSSQPPMAPVRPIAEQRSSPKVAVPPLRLQPVQLTGAALDGCTTTSGPWFYGPDCLAPDTRRHLLQQHIDSMVGVQCAAPSSNVIDDLAQRLRAMSQQLEGERTQREELQHQLQVARMRQEGSVSVTRIPKGNVTAPNNNYKQHVTLPPQESSIDVLHKGH